MAQDTLHTGNQCNMPSTQSGQDAWHTQATSSRHPDNTCKWCQMSRVSALSHLCKMVAWFCSSCVWETPAEAATATFCGCEGCPMAMMTLPRPDVCCCCCCCCCCSTAVCRICCCCTAEICWMLTEGLATWLVEAEVPLLVDSAGSSSSVEVMKSSTHLKQSSCSPGET